MNTEKITDKNFPNKKGTKALPVFAHRFNDLYDDVETIETKVDAVSGTTGTLSANTISEYTSGSGVTADGVLLKDSDVLADTIYANTISEATSETGVIVDGVTLKSGSITNTSNRVIETLDDSTFGALTKIAVSETHEIVGGEQTEDITLNIPSGARLLGSIVRNDTLIVGADDATGLIPITDYSISYKTGSSTVIDSAVALAANTKDSYMYDANAATDITTDVTDIVIDAGTDNQFTSGTISVIVFYEYMILPADL